MIGVLGFIETTVPRHIDHRSNTFNVFIVMTLCNITFDFGQKTHLLPNQPPSYYCRYFEEVCKTWEMIKAKSGARSGIRTDFAIIKGYL